MRTGTGGLALLLVVGAAGPAIAARGAEEHAKASKKPAVAAVDPDALAALDKMGAFLRAQESMAVTASMETDDVLPSGEKVQYLGNAQLQVRRPDKLHVDVITDRRNQQFFYDGKTATIFEPKSGYYATFPAPPTLGEFVELAEHKYGIDLPLADLFYWGTDRDHRAGIKSAVNVGPSKVDDVECDHFAFHQSDVDWQIWIQRGDQPLPRRLVITTTTERAQPEHTVVMSWALAPALDDKMFAFEPPEGAQQIEIVAAGTKGGAGAAAGATPKQGQGRAKRPPRGGTTP